MKFLRFAVAGSAALLALAPAAAFACACGCGIFDVGDGTVMPSQTGDGITLWARYAHMVQSDLREKGHGADAADNPDKRIATDFYTIGGQYAINRKWTVMAQLPIVDRSFTTTDEGDYAAPEGTVNTRHMTAAGDAMVRLTYTGLSPDQTTGVGIGVKLPTGRWHSYKGPLGDDAFDRDTLPGSGSTDLQFHAYHVGQVHGALSYYAQGQFQFAVASQDGYRPGNEFDAAVGLTYDMGRSGLAPSLALLGSARARDTGVNSDTDNTGYSRLLIAPGLKVRLNRRMSVFGDVEVPIAQYVRSADPASGDAGQLVAPVTFRLQINFMI